MERVIGATEARVHFGELMRQVVEREQTVIVERDGKPQVVVLSVAAYERLHAASGRKSWEEALARALEVGVRIDARRRGRALTPADEVLREMREERDAHFPDLR